MSVPTKGRIPPKTGEELPFSNELDRAHYALLMADALKQELRTSKLSIKTVMKWTGAGERTVKAWLAGRNGPSGHHLIRLLKHSQCIWQRVALVVGRSPILGSSRLDELETALRVTLSILESTQGHRGP
jgi:hypothetical protein